MHNHAMQKKQDCVLKGKYRTENMIYKSIASRTGYTSKMYFGPAEEDL